MRVRAFVFAAAAFAACIQIVSAADAPMGLAAGYKALFTCSGTFLANRSSEQIERNELTGIYTDYAAPMAKLGPAQIDQRRGFVGVAYDQLMPPRVAVYRRSLGCVLLPPGAGPSLRVPNIDLPPLRDDERRTAWPNGDKVARAPSGFTTRDKWGPLLKAAFDGKTYGKDTRTTAVVIASRERLIAEGYSADSGVYVPQRTWSVAKSLTGAIIGIAVKERLLRVEERVAFPQWSAPGDPRSQITFLHLMQMASGLDAGPAGNRTDEIYFGGGLIAEHATSHELVAPPGLRWNYANDDTMLLSLALRERIRDERVYLGYPYEKLFRRIGMRHTTAETDWGGTFVLSSQVWSTARDLTRFGLLLLNDGKWNGQELLPAGWVGFMGTPAPVQPLAKRADGSAALGYGAQIWLFDERHGLPAGTLSAQGNRGQYIVVVPARGMVIVRRGFDGGGASFAVDKFAADVLIAMDAGGP